MENPIVMVLEKMGWDGMSIPVASEENRQLMEEINGLIREKDAKGVRVQDEDVRLKSLRAHFHHSEQEVVENLKLLNGQRVHLENENHWLKLNENEDSHLQRDIKTSYQDLNDVNDRQEITQKDLNRMKRSIDHFEGQISWIREALKEWNEVTARGEATNKLIERYCKQDASRANTLEAKRHLLQRNIVKQRERLVACEEQQKSLEMVLERTAQLYQQGNAERRTLIATWKEACLQMSQREREIEEAERDLQYTREITKKKEKRSEDLSGNLESHAAKAGEIQQEIAELNVKISDDRSRLTNLTDALALKVSEMESLRKSLVSMSQELQRQRQKNRQWLSEKNTKENLLIDWQNIYEDLSKRHEAFRSKKYNADERLRQLEELYEVEEKNIKILSGETNKLTTAIFKTQQHLSELQGEEKVRDMEIQGLEGTIKRMRAFARSQTTEIGRQTAILYHLDFEIQQTLARIDNMSGKSVELDTDCVEKIQQQEEILARKKRTHLLLQSQINNIEESRKRLDYVFNCDAQELERLASRLKETQLRCESGEKSIRHVTVANQEKLVEQSILKMKVQQFERQLENQSERRFNFERHRLGLEAAINQRFLDIEAHKKLLWAKKKHFSDERQHLRAEVGDRSVKIETLKKRYQLIEDVLRRNEDGSAMTPIQIRIRAAQEKQILLKEGNELNAKVLKAEADIKAMENTVRLVNLANENYKRNFVTVEEDSPFLQELENLQDAYFQAVRKLKNLRGNLVFKSDQLETLNGQKEHLERELEEVSREKGDRNDVLMKVHKELLEQKVKLHRAEREMKQAFKAAKLKINDSDFLTIQERDFTARELEEQNSSALQQLADLVEANPGLGPAVSKYLLDKGLSMPTSRAKSQTSWKSDRSDNIDYQTVKPISIGSPASSVSGKSAVAGPAIVMIDFPESVDTQAKATVSRKSSSKCSAQSRNQN
ncbi:coiled-coil domain-containing protein 39 [Phlebotomus argentipes]|uniref:coiled-coil domain-containing protein 39 n=1 Tax=Phlebotomus argentipes TaxID=94469 RepID=UPI002893390F|nr:coiled-coil domain-containing protein 39 [Phlebotomus argentipes]